MTIFMNAPGVCGPLRRLCLPDAECLLDEDGAVRVGVLREHALEGGAADRRGALGRETREDVRDLEAVPRDEDLALRLEEGLDSLPRVGDEAGARARRLEHARRGREAVARHAVAAHV